MRHASKREKIVWVGKGRPSGDFEMWVPHPCAVCKGAVFLINELDRFLCLFYKAGGSGTEWGEWIGCPTHRVYVWGF